MKGALQGRTIVVTRPRAQAAGLIQALRGAGARVVAAPLLRIAPPRSWAALDDALRGLARFDAVVFASQNAADRFFGRARALRLSPVRRPGRLFAVGPKTARRLARRGWKAAALGERYNGASLARAMGDVRGLRVLVPRAEAAREELPALLRKAGAKVIPVEVYRAVGDARGARALRLAARDGVDAVVFASPSAVERFARALGAQASRRMLAGAAAASIGPVTTAALKRRGARSVIEARRATDEALVAGLRAHFRSHGRL